MPKEKISDNKKREIAKMNLHGKQFKRLANVLDVSETTARKADKIGGYLNKIDALEYENRTKDVQIALLSSQKMVIPFQKTKHK